MKIKQFTFFLVSFIFAGFVSAAASSLDFPANFLFATIDPRVQVRTVCYKSEEWLRDYLTFVKDIGYNLNVSFKGGDTLLHMAIQEGSPIMVKVLLELGADVSKKNSQGESPLEYISYLVNHRSGYEDIGEVFYAAGHKLLSKAEESRSEFEGTSEPRAEDEDGRPSKIAKTASLEDMEILKAPISNDPLFDRSTVQDLDLSLDLKDVVQLFDEVVEILPIPPRYIPTIPTQYVVDPQFFDMGERFIII